MFGSKKRTQVQETAPQQEISFSSPAEYFEQERRNEEEHQRACAIRDREWTQKRDVDIYSRSISIGFDESGIIEWRVSPDSTSRIKSMHGFIGMHWRFNVAVTCDTTTIGLWDQDGGRQAVKQLPTNQKNAQKLMEMASELLRFGGVPR